MRGCPPEVVSTFSCARTFGLRLALVEDRAHHVLGVGLLLRDPDVDRERLVGQRDGEADPVAHLLHDHRDLLLERVAGDPRLLEDERRLGDRAERARLGDGGGEAGERDRPDPAHPGLHERDTRSRSAPTAAFSVPCSGLLVDVN